MKHIIVAFLLLFFSVSASASQSLKNGAPLFASRVPDLPREIYHIKYLGGASVLPPEHQGVLGILRRILKEGPADISEAQFKEKLFSLTIEIDYIISDQYFGITVKAPPGQEAEAFELLKRTLANPRTDKVTFERFKADLLSSLRVSFESMSHVASYFAYRDFYSYSPEVMNGNTSPTTLEKLTHEEFTSAIKLLFNDQRMFLTYVGRHSAKEARKKFEAAFADRLQKKFLKWKPELPKIRSAQGLRYTIINKPGATDNQVLFIFPQKVKPASQESIEGAIAMDLLGGGLHGRLGQTLRSARGLTYGVNSGTSPYLSNWAVYTFGGNEQIGPLVQGVLEVVNQFKNEKLSATEIEEAKERLLTSFKSNTELPFDRMSYRVGYFVSGLDQKYVDRYERLLKSASIRGVSKLKNRLNSENGALYLMGDKEVLLTALEKNGIKRDAVRIVEVSEIR